MFTLNFNLEITNCLVFINHTWFKLIKIAVNLINLFRLFNNLLLSLTQFILQSLILMLQLLNLCTLQLYNITLPLNYLLMLFNLIQQTNKHILICLSNFMVILTNLQFKILNNIVKLLYFSLQLITFNTNSNILVLRYSKLLV